MIVVGDGMPWPDNNGLVGVSSFGFGGANCHTLLKWHEKVKVNNGLPQDNLPRLVCVSARSEASLKNILNDLQTQPLDGEYVALYHNSFKRNHENNYYRGYAILTKTSLHQSQWTYVDDQKNICLYFGARFKNLPKILTALTPLPLFAKTIEDFVRSLRNNSINFDMQQLLANFDSNNPLHIVLGTVLIQATIYQIFIALKLPFKNIFGQSIGALLSNYALGNLNFDELISLAYFYGKCLKDACFDTTNGNLREQISGLVQHMVKSRTNPNFGFEEDLIGNLLCLNLENLKIPPDSVTVVCGEGLQEFQKEESVRIFEEDDTELLHLYHGLGRFVFTLMVEMFLDNAIVSDCTFWAAIWIWLKYTPKSNFQFREERQ